jgi:tetratricopeptide (TPR) repeat protein/predicted Ser/Thr protein kinase
MSKLATDSGPNQIASAANPTLPAASNSASAVDSLHPGLEPGTVLSGRYRILNLLGEGGMGAVYKAEDVELGRVVALKVIRREYAGDASTMERFKQELILAREVTHHNVIRLYDIGNTGEMDFITMEFVDGEDIGTILRRQGKFSAREAAEIIEQVCHGLQAAHEQSIIHRDLKPGNIMREKSGRIVLMDFGLARPVAHESLTQSGALVGTMEYMSPEQAKGVHIDARSDLFAVGLVLYELLTGTRPYKADTAIASLLKRLREPAEPPDTRDASIPAPLSRICSKSLQMDPAHRYQSATALLTDVEEWLHPQGKKRRFVWPAVAVVFATIALAIAGTLVFRLLSIRPATTHPAISVLVANFANHTGDTVFDDTLEPMFNVALEGASFLNAFSRGQAHKVALKLPRPSDKLDEETARLVAVSKGVPVVLSGSLDRLNTGYRISVRAIDARTGNIIRDASTTVRTKDDVLPVVPKLVAPIRKALGDSTPASVQLEKAGGAFTAASLEAVHQYSIGMEEQFAGKNQEALQSFSKAAELDPGFARAYAGMAGVAIKMEQLRDADKFIKLAMQHGDRLTDREMFRVRGLYYLTAGNWHKCAEEYDELAKRYPGDNIAHNNLAVCLSQTRNLSRAVEEARADSQINPNAAAAANLSLFSSYAGAFQDGERHARQLQQDYPSFPFGHLALALAELGQDHLSQAEESYHKLAEAGPLGASFGASGRADLALYEGRFADAIRLFEQGAAADLATKNPDAAAEKLTALAYTEFLSGRQKAAAASADKALANSKAVKIRFLVAQTYAQAGQIAKAQQLAAGLASELYAEPQAYAKIIEGDIAMKHGDAHKAVSAITEANRLLDTWIGRFELGRAYMEAGANPEADSEFDRCVTRRGEALALFLDLVPTYGYVPAVYYYQGQVRERMKNAAFAESYRTYLSIRGKAGEDPLLPEIHRRLRQSGSKFD